MYPALTMTGLVPLLPEIVLGLAAIVLLIVAGLIVLALPGGKLVTFGGSFVVDDFARFLKILAILGSAAAILMSIDYDKREKQQRFEYSVLIVLSTLGMLMLISAADLIALYLGLELMSLPLYVVAASHRSSLRSTGFCFKVSAVPFHMWTPDVYEGAPTPVTAFFAAAPKVAGIAMFVRVAVSAFPGITGQWQEIVAFVSVASMLLGSFAAIGQRNIKRLMAYSSIGHMGFALIGLAAGTSEGVQGVLVYMAIYVTMTLGVFAVILSMRRSGGMVESIDQLAGLARTHPTMAFFLAMLLFSMAGVPPLAGFFAKFYVFLAAIKAGLYILAVIGVLASVVGAYYYLAIVKIMYFDEPAEDFYSMPDELKVVLGICGLFNILFFVYPGPLVGVASAAAHSLF